MPQSFENMHDLAKSDDNLFSTVALGNFGILDFREFERSVLGNYYLWELIEMSRFARFENIDIQNCFDVLKDF